MDSATAATIKSNIATIRTKLTAIESLLSSSPLPAPVPTPTPTPTPSPVASTGTKFHVWVYPGAPALDAPSTYKNNKIDVIRAEYFRLSATGVLQQVVENSNDFTNTKNAYSPANVAEIKVYSTEQLVTVAGDYNGLRAFAASPDKSKTAIDTLLTFVVNNGLTGIDIDIEGFGNWTTTDYMTYLNFMKALGTALQNAGKKLALCGPNWTSAFDSNPLACGWNWNHFISLPIDYITPMMYDWQWDMGAGTPVAPLAWLGEWSDRLVKMFGADRLVIGIPSYGYTGTRGKWDIKILTLDQIKLANGYAGGTRDASSGEIFKDVGAKFYCSNDRVSLNAKRAVIEAKGVKNISVWHAGGNDWF